MNHIFFAQPHRTASLFLALAFLFASAAFVSPAFAAGGDQKKPKQMEWSFDGIMGTVDENAAQRGLQVYREVCAACHGLKRVAFRSLTEIGFSPEEVKALAAEYTLEDGPNDEGEMFERPGKPFDKFPGPYANQKQARAMNNGAYPVDLSLITKARGDGPNYVYSLLTGYTEAPAGTKVDEGQYYNPYYSGGKLAMAAPIQDGSVEYQDGTEASKEQIASDLVSFLQWAAEPEMEERKRMGLKVMIYLVIFTAFFYIAMKRIWRGVKAK